MDALTELGKNILDTLTGITKYTIEQAKFVKDLIESTNDASAEVARNVSFLPPFVITTLMGIVAVAVFYKIVGREG